MLAVDNADLHQHELYNLSEETDIYYSAIYEDAEGSADVFIVFTPSFSIHIISHSGIILYKDLTIYKLDTSSSLTAIVYTSENNFFTLLFSDEQSCSMCNDKLIFYHLSSSAEMNVPGNLVIPRRSTSTLCKTEVANHLSSHLDSPTVTSIEAYTTTSDDVGHLSNSEILCLYMHTSVFDESFTHVFRLFYNEIVLKNDEIMTLIVSPMKEDILDRTLTTLSAYALYLTHTQLHTQDLISILSIVNIFILHNVTLSYELLLYDIRVTDPPGAHLRGRTPKDSFSIEKTAYPYDFIRYLDILQQILNHRVISFSNTQQSVLLTDERLTESIITSLVIYFDSVCNFISIFFGAPSLAPLKRFFHTSSNVEITAILSTSLYLQLQEILKYLFIVLSGCLPHATSECLLEFDPFHTAPTFNYQSVKKYLLKHLHNCDVLNQSCLSHKDTIEAILYAQSNHMTRKDMIYNLLYLSFTILDTFNQAASLDESLPQLTIPNFSEKDTCLLFDGLVYELDANIITLFLSLSLKDLDNYSLVKKLLFGDLSVLLSIESNDLDQKKSNSKQDKDVSINILVYRASQRFWSIVKPLIMLLRTLTAIFKSSAAFLFEFNSDLCLHLMNCVIFIFMDEHFDLLHKSIAIDAEQYLLSSQADPTSVENSSKTHGFLTMEMLLRDFIQRIRQVLIGMLETFTSISLSVSSSTVSLLHQSCYKSAILGSVYLSSRIIRFCQPIGNSSFGIAFSTYTDTCMNSDINIIKQLVSGNTSIYLDLSVYLMLAQQLQQLQTLSYSINDGIGNTPTITVANDTIIRYLITFIVKHIIQIPDRLDENDSDPIISLSLGLEIINILDVKSLFVDLSHKQVEDQSILKELIICCGEQARLLSLLFAKIPSVMEAFIPHTVPLSSLTVDTEASMTINMLDPGCNGAFSQQQFKESIKLHIQTLLTNLVALYSHLQIQSFIDSFLAVSKDSITYSSELMNTIKQANTTADCKAEVFDGAVDSVECIAQCLINDALPFLGKEDNLFIDIIKTVSHILLGFLLFSLYQQLAIARTAADFYKPNNLFTIYLSFIRAYFSTISLSTEKYRILFVAIDAQGIIYRTLSRNVDVLKETIAAYEILNTVTAGLHKSDIFDSDDDVSTSTMSSHISHSVLVSHIGRRNNKLSVSDKLSQGLLLSYLDSLSATFSYIAKKPLSSTDSLVLILSAIISLFDCISPTSMLRSEDIKFDELIDLREYLESGHEVYNDTFLEEVRNLFKNKVVLSYMYKIIDNRQCNPLLLSTLSTAIASSDGQLKKLGVSLLYRCLIVIAVKGVSGTEFFSFLFSPDMCVHLLSVFTPDTMNVTDGLLDSVLGVFDLGLQFLYEVENIPVQKRKGLTSLIQYRNSYSKIIDTLITLVSKDYLSIPVSFYLRLFPFLTNFVVLFNRSNLFKGFSTSFNALITTLIETTMPNYQQLMGIHDPLPLLFAMANTLYTYLCICIYKRTFVERSHNIMRDKSIRRSSIAARDINHMALSEPVDEVSGEKIGTIIITICTLLLNCFQSISESVADNNEISFKKAISILYNLSQFGFTGSDCIYFLLYTYVGAISHIGFLQMTDNDKEYDLQIKCIVRLFKAIDNVIKNPCHSTFIEDSLTNVLLANGNDFLVFICVCLAISVQNATLYKSLVQPYERLVKDGTDNPVVPRWLSLFRLIKRARNLIDPVDSLVGTALNVLYCMLNHLSNKPTEQISMFTIGPGRYLLPLLVYCFINNLEITDNQTLASYIYVHSQAELSSQKPNKCHAHVAIQTLAMSTRAAPMQASTILMSKNTMSILISSFEKLISVLLDSEACGDSQDLTNQPNHELERDIAITEIVGEILSIYADMALIRECFSIFRESDNRLLILIADFLQHLVQNYKKHSANSEKNATLVSLHVKMDRCMTLAVLTLRNIVITAEDLSYITMKVRGTKTYVLIGGVYEYITLYNTNTRIDMTGIPAAIEYLIVIIMHLITQVEKTGTDHHAIAVIKKYALQLEQNMQSALQKDVYVEECTALLGALNMLP